MSFEKSEIDDFFLFINVCSLLAICIVAGLPSCSEVTGAPVNRERCKLWTEAGFLISNT